MQKLNQNEIQIARHREYGDDGHGSIDFGDQTGNARIMLTLICPKCSAHCHPSEALQVIVQLLQPRRQTNAHGNYHQIHVRPNEYAIIVDYLDEKCHISTVVRRECVQLWPSLHKIALQTGAVRTIDPTIDARHYGHRVLN